LAAVVFLAILAQGMLGAFVVVPIVCINWSWNSVVSQYTQLPPIVWWQATLIYLTVACLIYLSGFIRVEVKAEKID